MQICTIFFEKKPKNISNAFLPPQGVPPAEKPLFLFAHPGAARGRFIGAQGPALRRAAQHVAGARPFGQLRHRRFAPVGAGQDKERAFAPIHDIKFIVRSAHQSALLTR